MTDIELAMYCDRALPPAHRQHIESHLSSCAKCLQRKQNLQDDEVLLDNVRHAAQRAHATRQSSPLIDSKAFKDHIKGYTVLRELQRGGQGIVYEALQQATKRRVALKVLLGGPFADDRRRRRFESEVELASQLRHPNIVAIYDSGLVDEHFYYAMEYVDGLRLDDYVQFGSLELRTLVQLFNAICNAVSYAHQHGVIHRDLKPSNIRVDREGQPHLLDFGLAKRSEPLLTHEQSVVTLTSEFVGTPAYAAPEQTWGQPSAIDTRTDVYALGVMLYEMLTGTFPYPVSGNMSEVMKHIAETEPQRPSALCPEIDNDLETIILKALAKSPETRYQTARHLSDDLERYLRGDAIEAKRASTLYMMRKLIRRNRYPLGIVACVMLTLSALFTWYRWNLSEERQATVAAQQARLDAAVRHEQASEIYQEAVDLIRRNVLYQEALTLLERASSVDPDFVVAHFERGQLRLLLSRDDSMDSKEREVLLDKAIHDLEKAHEAAGGDWLTDPQTHEPVPPETARNLPCNADGLLVNFPDVRRTTDGRLMQRHQDGTEKRVGGPGFPRALLAAGDALRNVDRLDQAHAYYAKAQQLNPDDIYVRISQAIVLQHQKENWQRAVTLLEDLAHTRIGKAIKEVWFTLGYIYLKADIQDQDETTVLYNRSRAMQCFSKTLELDPSHAVAQQYLVELKNTPEIPSKRAKQDTQAQDWVHESMKLRRSGDLSEAIKHSRKSVDVAPNYRFAWFNLGWQLNMKGWQEESIDAYEQCVACDPDFAPCWNNMGHVYMSIHQHEKAMECFRECLRAEPNHHNGLRNLVYCLIRKGRFAEAEEACQKGLANRTRWKEVHVGLSIARIMQLPQGQRASYAAVLLDGRRSELISEYTWMLLTASTPEVRDAPLALKMAQHLTRYYPQNVVFSKMLALAYLHNEEPQSAIKLLDQLPADNEALAEYIGYMRAMAYAQLNRKQMALQFYRETHTRHVQREHEDHELIIIRDQTKDLLLGRGIQVAEN